MQALSYDLAKTLRRRQTDAEAFLWQKLRNRQISGFKFKRQQPIGRYIVDFICMEQRLIVELDGGQHNLRQALDEVRSSFLNTEGYRVLRFWNDAVFKELDAVLEVILAELVGHPSPQPSPPRGEGAKIRMRSRKQSSS